MKKTIRARTALSVISEPHVALTELRLTSWRSTPALVASSWRTLLCTSAGWAPTWMRMRSPRAPS